MTQRTSCTPIVTPRKCHNIRVGNNITFHNGIFWTWNIPKDFSIFYSHVRFENVLDGRFRTSCLSLLPPQVQICLKKTLPPPPSPSFHDKTYLREHASSRPNQTLCGNGRQYVYIHKNSKRFSCCRRNVYGAYENDALATVSADFK